MLFAECRLRLGMQKGKNVLNVCQCVFLSACLWKMPVNLLTSLIVGVGVEAQSAENEATDPEIKWWPPQLFLPLGCKGRNNPLAPVFLVTPVSSSSSAVLSLWGEKAPCSDNRHFLPYVGLTSSSGSQQVTLVNFHSTAWWDFLPLFLQWSRLKV